MPVGDHRCDCGGRHGSTEMLTPAEKISGVQRHVCPGMAESKAIDGVWRRHKVSQLDIKLAKEFFKQKNDEARKATVSSGKSAKSSTQH
jgi:hypothetical protein